MTTFRDWQAPSNELETTNAIAWADCTICPDPLSPVRMEWNDGYDAIIRSSERLLDKVFRDCPLDMIVEERAAWRIERIMELHRQRNNAILALLDYLVPGYSGWRPMGGKCLPSINATVIDVYGDTWRQGSDLEPVEQAKPKQARKSSARRPGKRERDAIKAEDTVLEGIPYRLIEQADKA